MSTGSTQKLLSSWSTILLVLLTLAVLPLLLVFDRTSVGTTLEKIRESGKLRVIMLNGPTTFYEGPDGLTGIEYDLAKGFADSLGVEMEVEVASTFGSILPRLMRGDAHLAAGVTITRERKNIARFGPPYQEIKQQVIYLRNTSRPRDLDDLAGRQVEVVAGGSAAELLRELKVKNPKLEWRETSEKNAEELLSEVWEGLLEVTITDSNLISVTRQYYPQLHIAFDLPEPEQLAWAFPAAGDDSLYRAASDYINRLNSSGELARLVERYYGAVQRFNYVNLSTFRRRVASDLPPLEKTFKRAARASALDWRLLAAQAYQESQWDPKAVSPTGVVGIMQLTEATAARYDLDDRADPKLSIQIGARYLKELRNSLPERITEPDRTWLALAAYNIGLGHLEDARILTQKEGGNPDTWVDVKQYLPLLMKPKWYQTTKHGYARGNETVSYVTRIRSFYDVLVKMRPDAEIDLDKLNFKVPAL